MRLLPILALVAVASVLVPKLTTPPGPTTGPASGPRVAALSPAVAIIVRDLGLEGQVVARHAWDMVLPRSVPVAGDQSGLDYEALLRARPTHVVTQWGSRELPPVLGELARTRGWKVIDLKLSTLAEVESGVTTLAEALGSDRGAEVVADLRASWAPRAGAPAAGPVLLLASTSPPIALGPGSFHHEVLERLGGVGAIARGTPWMELSVEDVARLNPGCLVVINAGTPEATEDVLGPLKGLAIPAIEHDRVLVITDPLAFAPASSLRDVARRLGDALDRWGAGPTPPEPGPPPFGAGG